MKDERNEQTMTDEHLKALEESGEAQVALERLEQNMQTENAVNDHID